MRGSAGDFRWTSDAPASTASSRILSRSTGISERFSLSRDPPFGSTEFRAVTRDYTECRTRFPIRVHQARVEAISGEVDLPLVDVDAPDSGGQVPQTQQIARRPGRPPLIVGQYGPAVSRREAHDPARLGKPDLARDEGEHAAGPGAAKAVRVRVVVQSPQPREGPVQRAAEARE